MQKLTYLENIYTYHIDFVGHVNNAVYIQWMENGRLKLLEAIGMPVTRIAEGEGIVPVLTETHIRYRKPYFLGDTARIEIWLSQLNNASAIMEFRFYNPSGDLCAEGWQKGLFVNRKTLRPQRLAESFREAFSKYLIEKK